MKLKRSSSLIMTFEPQGIVVQNFLIKEKFLCTADCIDFLRQITEWTDLETIYLILQKHFNFSQIKKTLQQLIKMHALVIQHSPMGKLDELYKNQWEWGTTAGLYHFAIRNIRFLPGDKQRAAIRKRRSEKPEPSATTTNEKYSTVKTLPEFKAGNDLFLTMQKRRSQRFFKEDAIPLSALSDCLFTAKGIKQWADDEDFGRLPLTMTPSGGARNPYELYVYANKINGLETGFYHYSGENHDLGLINNTGVDMAKLFAGQEWTAESAAAIFLVANFERSAWKYHLPPAYRIVLIEAGFIGQNIALTATKHGLTAVPTGAVSEALIEKYLETKPIKEAHILSLIIGNPE